MNTRSGLGEFEQLVLLAVLQLDSEAVGPEIARIVEEAADRTVSRGALYSSLERLERKGFLTWRIPESGPGHRGQPMRRFSVTDAGLDALRAHRNALLTLWAGLENRLAPKARR